jgi:hypothetical protein
MDEGRKLFHQLIQYHHRRVRENPEEQMASEHLSHAKSESRQDEGVFDKLRHQLGESVDIQKIPRLGN